MGWCPLLTRLLLTGGTGFIGSHLGPRLEAEGYDVIALARHVSKRDVPIAFGKVINCDLTDFGFIENKVAELRPEIIVNLAAQSLVPYSFSHIVEVPAANFLGAINLMEAARKHVPNLELFVQASTSEVYGYQDKFPIREDAMKRPHCPYSIAKHAVDCYAKYLDLAYDFPYFLMRSFNTYGERDSLRRVTERTIAQMLKLPRIELGDPDCIRDFLYVDDTIDAYVAVINRRLKGMEMNICTGVGITIYDWVYKIAEIMDYKGEIQFNATYKRPTDIPVLIGCSERARKVLGWKPKYNHEDGLAKAIPKVKDYVERTGWTKPTGGWS